MTYLIKVTPNGATVEFEVGSLAEAVEILTENENTLTRFLGIRVNQGGEGTQDGGGSPEQAPRRGRRPKATGADAAPAPASPAPATDGLEIPPFLDRRPGAGAPAPIPTSPVAQAPAPAPVPAAPPAPPAAAPGGVLAPKVEAELKRRGTDPVAQKSLVEWLAHPATGGLVISSATFDEACQCIRFMSDDKLSNVAKALQVG